MKTSEVRELVDSFSKKYEDGFEFWVGPMIIGVNHDWSRSEYAFFVEIFPQSDASIRYEQHVSEQLLNYCDQPGYYVFQILEDLAQNALDAYADGYSFPVHHLTDNSPCQGRP